MDCFFLFCPSNLKWQTTNIFTAYLFFSAFHLTVKLLRTWSALQRDVVPSESFFKVSAGWFHLPVEIKN